MNKTFHVNGMFCPNCEKRIDKALEELPGVHTVKSDYRNEEICLEYDETVFEFDRVKSTIESLGYQIDTDSDVLQVVSILIIILSAYVILRHLGLLQIFNVFPSIENSFSIGVIFVTGILTSVHCVAMCGGIVLSQSVLSAQRRTSITNDNFRYNCGRLLSYTLIGAAAGGLGTLIGLNGYLKGLIALLAGITMMIMGFNMLGIFKVFRKIRFPFVSDLYKKLRKVLKTRSPFLIGVLNGFMPCGPLQSMQIYALSSGSILKGALSMLVFGLGTIPLMYGFGFISGKINRKYTGTMLKVSAILIFVMGVNMFSNGLALSGFSSGISIFSKTNKEAVLSGDVQKIRTEVDYGSYESFTVRKNVPVEWIIYVSEEKLNGCNGEIIVPEYDLDIVLHVGENLVTFTPKKTGEVPYSCWMGMIRSTIKVID